MPRILDAVSLAIALRATGTGDGKLEPIRALLAINPNATSEDAIHALIETQTITEHTISKARELAEFGQLRLKSEGESTVITIEQKIMMDRAKARELAIRDEAIRKLAEAELKASATLPPVPPPPVVPPTPPVPPPPEPVVADPPKAVEAPLPAISAGNTPGISKPEVIKDSNKPGVGKPTNGK